LYTPHPISSIIKIEAIISPLSGIRIPNDRCLGQTHIGL
jgi:hypothetical protein